MAHQPDDRLLVRDAIIRLRRERRLMRLDPERFEELRRHWHSDKMARPDAEKRTVKGG